MIEAAARAAHEANRAYCIAIGDNSQASWEETPKNIRESAMVGVRAIEANPGTTSEQSHEGWLAFKRADGWVYGEVKDAALKTHHCMVPYGDLPIEQRAKDAIFGSVVRAVLAALGAT